MPAEADSNSILEDFARTQFLELEATAGIAGPQHESSATRPFPNWFDTWVSLPFANTMSKSFSLCIVRPYSSFNCPTIFRVFVSMTSPEEI